MANLYTRSTDGNNADGGTTWALAKLDGAGVTAIDSAGDTLWFSQSHAESTASAITFAVAGTLATPSRLLCGNDGAEPPTALATTGSVTTTGNSSITLSGAFYCYGLSFEVGTGASGASAALGLGTAGMPQVYEACKFKLNTSSGSQHIGLALSSTPAKTTWINCDLKLGAAAQAFDVGHEFEWRGGSLLSGTATPSALFAFGQNRLGNVLVDGVDFSNSGAGLVFASNSFGNGTAHLVVRNCKLPSSWSGTLWSGTPAAPGARAEMRNCNAGDINYALWVEDYAGSIKHETTLVKTGGASDGTTPLSWKMATSANAEYPTIVLISPEIGKWNETVGSSVTVTVDILHDSATNLKDNEIWIEVEYLGTSGFRLGSFTKDAMADVLATAADQASSSATWTTTGMSNPNKQKLNVSFTPQEKGLLIARVCMAKASYTAYVDPELQIS